MSSPRNPALNLSIVVVFSIIIYSHDSEFSYPDGSSGTSDTLYAVHQAWNGRDAGCFGQNAATITLTMDALSDLLRVVRFSGGMFLESKFREPWCVRSHIVPADCGPDVKADCGLLGFHYVLDGHMQVRVGNEPPRAAGPGDIILISRNDPHLLGSDVTMPPVDARPLIRKAEADVVARLDFGTGRQVKNRFVCGYLATAMRDHPLLTALPPLLVADLSGQPSAEWA